MLGGAGSGKSVLPAPHRHSHVDVDAAEAAGLRFVGAEDLGHEVPMTATPLTNCLLSQSNVTSAIDSGRTTLDELRARLRAELGQRMPANTVSAQFTGNMRCYRTTQ